MSNTDNSHSKKKWLLCGASFLAVALITGAAVGGSLVSKKKYEEELAAINAQNQPCELKINDSHEPVLELTLAASKAGTTLTEVETKDLEREILTAYNEASGGCSEEFKRWMYGITVADQEVIKHTVLEPESESAIARTFDNEYILKIQFETMISCDGCDDNEAFASNLPEVFGSRASSRKLASGSGGKIVQAIEEAVEKTLNTHVTVMAVTSGEVQQMSYYVESASEQSGFYGKVGNASSQSKGSKGSKSYNNAGNVAFAQSKGTKSYDNAPFAQSKGTKSYDNAASAQSKGSKASKGSTMEAAVVEATIGMKGMKGIKSSSLTQSACEFGNSLVSASKGSKGSKDCAQRAATPAPVAPGQTTSPTRFIYTPMPTPSPVSRVLTPRPTPLPTNAPVAETIVETPAPTPLPTPNPTPDPTPQPTMPPTMPPTPETAQPTRFIYTPQPTLLPTNAPVAETIVETPAPTPLPTPNPTPDPTPQPTMPPTMPPTPETAQPTRFIYTPQPTLLPTNAPVAEAIVETPAPTPLPTPNPTPDPTPQPTMPPTMPPTPETAQPTRFIYTPQPTLLPTPNPTPLPTPNPTPEPTPQPTMNPTMPPFEEAETPPPCLDNPCFTNFTNNDIDTTCLPPVAEIISVDSWCGQQWDKWCVVTYNDCYETAQCDQAYIATLVDLSNPDGGVNRTNIQCPTSTAAPPTTIANGEVSFACPDERPNEGTACDGGSNYQCFYFQQDPSTYVNTGVRCNCDGNTFSCAEN